MSSITADQKSKKKCKNCNFQGIKKGKNGGTDDKNIFFCSRDCQIKHHRQQKRRKKFAENLQKNLEKKSSGLDVFQNRSVKVIKIDGDFCESCMAYELFHKSKTCNHTFREKQIAIKHKKVAEDATMEHFFQFGSVFGRQFIPSVCQSCNKIHTYKNYHSEVCTKCMNSICLQCQKKGEVDLHHCEPFVIINMEIDFDSMSNIFFLQVFEAVDGSYFAKTVDGQIQRAVFYGCKYKQYQEGLVYEKDEYFVRKGRLFIAKKKTVAKKVCERTDWDQRFTFKDFKGSRDYQTYTVVDTDGTNQKKIYMFAIFPRKSFTRFKGMVIAQGGSILPGESICLSENACFNNMHTNGRTFNFYEQVLSDFDKYGCCLLVDEVNEKKKCIFTKVCYQIEKKSENFLKIRSDEFKGTANFTDVNLVMACFHTTHCGNRNHIIKCAKSMKDIYQGTLKWDAKSFGKWLKKSKSKHPKEEIYAFVKSFFKKDDRLTVASEDVDEILKKMMGRDPYGFFMLSYPTYVGDVLYEHSVEKCKAVAMGEEYSDLRKKKIWKKFDCLKSADDDIVRTIRFVKNSRVLSSKDLPRSTFHEVSRELYRSFFIEFVRGGIVWSTDEKSLDMKYVNAIANKLCDGMNLIAILMEVPYKPPKIMLGKNIQSKNGEGRVFKCNYHDGTYQYSVLDSNKKIFVVDEEEIIRKNKINNL